MDDAYNGNDTTTIYVLNDYTVLSTGFPENLCYFGTTVLPAGVPYGGVWSGECIINASTGELDPQLPVALAAQLLLNTHILLPTVMQFSKFRIFNPFYFPPQQ